VELSAAKLTMALIPLGLTAKPSMEFTGFMRCYAANCLVNSIVADCFVNFAVYWFGFRGVLL
jgi:hypothetical protein